MKTLACRTPDEIREWVLNGDFLTAKQFLSICKNGVGSGTGAGCYVILVFGRMHVPRNLSKFSMGYIGQSINVISRLKDHLTGNGNCKVYSDLERGMRIMVQIIPCSLESLNDLERALIAAFDRRKLYNQTAGGSKIRCHDGSEFILSDRRLLRPWTMDEIPMRRAVFSYAGDESVLLVIDGVKTCRLENGSRVSIDLREGRHRVKAKRMGRLTGKKRIKMKDGLEVTVKCGSFRIKVSSFRRSPKLDGMTVRTRDRTSEERLSCFYGENPEQG